MNNEHFLNIPVNPVFICGQRKADFSIIGVLLAIFNYFWNC